MKHDLRIRIETSKPIDNQKLLRAVRDALEAAWDKTPLEAVASLEIYHEQEMMTIACDRV